MIDIECNEFNIKQIAESGQCFRFFEISNNHYHIVAFGKVLEVFQHDDVIIFNCSRKDFCDIWRDYFDFRTFYSKIGASIDRDDTFLTSAYQYGSGIRILRQPLWETVVSFIISQRKSIPAIKISIERMCKAYGSKIEGTEYYAFPEPYQLVDMSKDDCGLGYRLPYINDLAKKVVNGEFNLEQLFELDYESAKKQLLSVRGIGEKVSNCICLFALGRIEACPIDVWMKKIIDENYNGVIPGWMRGQYAGLLQQYVFFYKRNMKKGGVG